jgi:hypothetical protein
MIWWRGCSTHGEREGKATWGRVAWLIVLVVVCCVFCVDFVCVDCRVEYLKLGKVILPQHLGGNDHPRMPSTCEYLPGLGEYSHVLGPGGGINKSHQLWGKS